MNMISKKHSIASALFILFAGICFILFHVYDKKKNDPRIYVHEIIVPGGWGYEVIYKNRILIHQGFIPAIPGNIAFQTREDALEVGQLALKRYLDTQRAAISTQDLDSLKIVIHVNPEERK